MRIATTETLASIQSQAADERISITADLIIEEGDYYWLPQAAGEDALLGEFPDLRGAIEAVNSAWGGGSWDLRLEPAGEEIVEAEAEEVA